MAAERTTASLSVQQCDAASPPYQGERGAPGQRRDLRLRARCRRLADLARRMGASTGVLPKVRVAVRPVSHPAAAADALAAVLFLHGPRAGLVLLAVTLSSPAIAAGGLIASIAALLFARLLGVTEAPCDDPAHLYNPMLTGLGCGFLLGAQPMLILYSVLAGMLALVLSLALRGVLMDLLRLPVLSLPFVFASLALWSAAHAGGLPIEPASAGAQAGVWLGSTWLVPADVALPAWLDEPLRAFGAILFVPHPLAGLVIAVLILLHSRILFLLALLGHVASVASAWPFPSPGADPVAGPAHFNAMLTAMALGGVYLVPSPRALVVVLFGVALCTLANRAGAQFTAATGLPLLTLSFNLVALTLLYALGRSRSPLLAGQPEATPERTLEQHQSDQGRFGAPMAEIALPFAGAWTLWQGFDGPWTHRGPWRHACDFIVTEPAGINAPPRSHRGDGSRLDDYYAWRKPVLAPCAGRVVAVIDDQPDNLPGQIDIRRPWGNAVVIASTRGWFVELSHFAQGSILVRESDQVQAGQRLGLCGSSGYSAQPHIHLQVQVSAEIGAATLPFRLLGFLDGGRFHARGIPAAGTVLENAGATGRVGQRLALPIGTRIRVRRTYAGAEQGEIDWSVEMDAIGRYRLASPQGRLYYAEDSSGFYFYRIEGDDPDLRLLFQALPMVPPEARRGIGWSDRVPPGALTNGLRRDALVMARALWSGNWGRYRGHWTDRRVIEGRLQVGLDGQSLRIHARLRGDGGLFETVAVGRHALTVERVVLA